MINVRDWLTERIDLGGLEALMRSKLVPHHRCSYIYYSGGVLLLFIGIQVITGTLLLAYYSPGENMAFESIVNLVSKVPLGVYIRSVHSWSSNLMALFLFIHLFSVLFYRGYRAPRELTWAGGFILLVLTLAFGFSGYLLPWNQLSVTATKVGTDAPKALGPIGAWVTLLLRGGEDVTGVTLGRFFALHVWGLPLLFFPFLALHLFFVQAQGMAVPFEIERKGEYSYLPFFPNVLYRDLAIWLVVLGLLITLSVGLPWEVGQKADPLAPTPERMKPEWYFLFLFQTLKLFPANILGISGETVAMALIALVILAAFVYPWIDRGAKDGKTPFLLRLVPYLGLIYFVGMTLWGFLA
jgi:quinol-cytochrome oxidoreductase complex cytochrome b subunit